MKFLKLLKYLKPYWLYALLAPLFMILEVIVSLFLPTIMSKIIDIGLASNDFDYVIKYSVLMIILAFVGLVFGLLLNYFSTNASIRMAADIRSEGFFKVQNMSFEQVDKLETGKIITRLTNDIMQVQNAVNMSLRMLFRAPFMLIGSIIMAFIFMPKLSFILLYMLPILVVIILVLFKFAAPLFKQIQERIDRVNIITQENLSGIRVVKAFVKEDFESKRFFKANTNLMNTMVKASRIIFIAFPLMFLIVNLGIVSTLYTGAYDPSIEAGQISGFVSYISFVMFSIMMLTAFIIMIPRAEASSGRILEILDSYNHLLNKNTSSLYAGENHEIKGKIEFRNVNFGYDTESSVLNNLNFTIKPGEKVGIIGPTGSGKSSLVNLIPRFYDCTNGEILIDDKDVRDYDIEQLREHISMVMQKTVLFSGSVIDNIKYGNLNATFEEVIKASNIAQAHPFISQFEEQYETMIKERGTNLSGGQKQRISIARALVGHPKILIFDDCTSAVDMKTEANIQKGLNEYMKNTTSIIVAQRIRSIKNADKIIVLKNGKIDAIGTHDELLETNEIYREINDSQDGGDDHE